MKKNEQGITLVELLATLTLLSIISILIWSVFSQGHRFSRESIVVSQLQQEANRIGTELMNFHRNAESEYTLQSSSCNILIHQNGQEEIRIESRMCLTISEGKNATTITIDPEQENKKLTLTVSEKGRGQNQVRIEIFLHRLKSGDEV